MATYNWIHENSNSSAGAFELTLNSLIAQSKSSLHFCRVSVYDPALKKAASLSRFRLEFVASTTLVTSAKILARVLQHR